jgi:hypothetical protein
MKQNSAGAARMGTILLLLGAASPLAGSEPAAADLRTVNVLQTNRALRVVTNVIEVRMPRNVFVDEFRTNTFVRTVTNVVEVPVTNWATRLMTNRVAVNLFLTNVVNRYQTNWTTHSRTNREEITLTNWDTVVVKTTNWETRELTNFTPVTLVRTNVVEHQQTNWTTVKVTNQATFIMTNWETVLVLRTNWVKQPATNVVEASVPASVPFGPVIPMKVMAREPEPKADFPRPESVPDALLLETSKTSRPADSTGVEVSFKVRLSSNEEAALQIQQWRVERDDRAVLISSQAQEFKRVLPPGRYQVLVRARRDAESPVLAQQSSLIVTLDGVTRK